jgi:hypothetical protein
MIAILLALAQSAAPPADIEFNAAVRARSLTIEKRGQASLTVKTDPEGENVIDVQAPRANGRKRIANPVVTVRVEARIADPGQNAAREETVPPQ